MPIRFTEAEAAKLGLGPVEQYDGSGDQPPQWFYDEMVRSYVPKMRLGHWLVVCLAIAGAVFGATWLWRSLTVLLVVILLNDVHLMSRTYVTLAEHMLGEEFPWLNHD